MNIEEITRDFVRNEKVTEFVKGFREKHGLRGYFFAPGSEDHLEAKEELMQAGAEEEIEKFLRELETDDSDPVSSLMLMPPETAARIPLKPIAEQVAAGLIAKIPDSMTWRDLLDNEHLGWLFKALIGDPVRIVLDLAVTGEVKPLSGDLLGKIEVVDIFGDQIMMAVAHEFTDIERLAAELKEKHHEVFGEKQTERNKKNALRDSFFENCFKEGFTNKQIVELWVEREPVIIPGYIGGRIPKNELKSLINRVKQARHRLKAR